MAGFMATISAITNIRRTAVPSAKKITELPIGSYTVVGRDHQASWLNVTYKTTDGRTLAGWILNKATIRITSDGATVSPQQIPISDYKYNDRPEVKSVMDYRRAQQQTWAQWLAIVAIAVGTGLLIHASSQGRKTDVTSYNVVAVISFVSAVVLWVIHRNISPKKFSFPVKKELEYLDKIRKSKPLKIKLGQVAAMAGAATVAAIGVAAVVAANKSNKSSTMKTSSRRLSSQSTNNLVRKTANTAVKVASASTSANISQSKPALPALQPTFDDRTSEPPEKGFGGAPAGSKQEQSNISAAIKEMQDRGLMQ